MLFYNVGLHPVDVHKWLKHVGQNDFTFVIKIVIFDGFLPFNLKL
jgi:hypothetical protein